MSKILEQTYGDLRSELKSFIRKRINDEAAAEDILHDVFIKAHAGIDGLKDTSKLNSWIYSITRNAITDHYRSKKPVSEINGFDIKDEPVEISVLKKLEPSVRAFIKDLPPIYREAIVLSDFRGMTQKSLAERLKISLPAVKSRILRARKMLKEQFLECCHFEFDKYGSVIDYHPACCSKCACA